MTGIISLYFFYLSPNRVHLCEQPSKTHQVGAIWLPSGPYLHPAWATFRWLCCEKWLPFLLCFAHNPSVARLKASSTSGSCLRQKPHFHGGAQRSSFQLAKSAMLILLLRLTDAPPFEWCTKLNSMPWETYDEFDTFQMQFFGICLSK